MTSKERVQTIFPKATCEYYESLRGAGEHCWYIRLGNHALVLSGICASPQAAWEDAAKGLFAVDGIELETKIDVVGTVGDGGNVTYHSKEKAGHQ